MKYLRTISLLFLIIVVGANAAGTATAQFLKLGVGARAVGMGEAYSAVSTGTDSTFWNPAGLAATEGYEVSFTHNEWIDDLRFEYAAVGVPLMGYGTVSVFYGQLTMGELEGFDRNGNPTHNFTAGDKLVGFGYGVGLFDILQVGAGFKYVMSEIEEEEATAYAGDFGVIAELPWVPRLTLGVAVHNIGSEMTFIEEGDPLPRGYRGGIGYSLPVGGIHNFVFAVDGVKYNDYEDPRANIGFEYSLLDMVSGRFGYKMDFESQSEDDSEANPDGLTMGAGFKHAIGGRLRMRFDYAYADMGDFGATHRVSLGVNF